MKKKDNIFDSTDTPINYSRIRVVDHRFHNLVYKDGKIVWVCKCTPVNKLVIERMALRAFRKDGYVS